nr:hypothetical protein [Thioalkalivibrio sp.]
MTVAEAVEDFLSFDEACYRGDWPEYQNAPAFEETHRRNADAEFREVESELF